MSSGASDHTLEILRTKLREQMNELADIVSTGGCQTFEEYKNLTGRIDGLALAERELLDLDDKLNSE